MLPTVMVLDLDGTIVGNVSPQVCEFEILTEHAPGKLKLFKDQLHAQLQHTPVIRPEFATFCRAMKERGVELYVYTASDAKWATLFVGAVERALGVKFNRPLFTRNHCRMMGGVYRKPTRAVLAAVFNGLKRRYAGLRKPSDLADQVAMVDNNNVLLQDAAYSMGMLLCPTYDYLHNYDVLRLVPEDVLAAKTSAVVAKLAQYKLLPAGVPYSSLDKLRAAYYVCLGRDIAASRKLRKKQAGDRMWRALQQALVKHNIRTFGPKALTYMESKLI